MAISEEEQATVNRRLILGLGGIAATIGVSQISENPFKDSKPLFLYLVPLVRIQALLVKCQDLAENGLWDELSVAQRQIVGKPNDAKANLFAAAGYLKGSQEEEARRIAFDFLEDMEAVDYRKYFDEIGALDPKKAKDYAKFTKRAA